MDLNDLKNDLASFASLFIITAPTSHGKIFDKTGQYKKSFAEIVSGTLKATANVGLLSNTTQIK